MIDDYFKLQEQIYNYFGYVENWAVIPLEDRRDYWWHEDGSEVHYTTTESNMKALIENDFNYDNAECDGNTYYADEIYTQRFLTKWVYRAEDYTMICVDTHTDGNKFLAIYDNKKEIK